ncbi:hypothetical protein Tco_0393175 [Tanacetum coccineum]
MVQPWEKVAKQRVTQSFSPETVISFPPLGDEDGTEGPMIIEAKIGVHFVHRIYVDGEASSEILYEHCFNRLRPEIRSQMVPATTRLIGFSGERNHLALVEHRLLKHTEKDAYPIDKMKRGQAPERNKAIQEEVEKLVDAGTIKEVHYHSWLSNPVMVKKHDRSWQMCVDFKDLNKACLQDGYPLPEIDWKVESLCGYPFK